MDTDDLEPLWTPLDKPDLQTMSLEQLVEYIAEMEAEIVRANEVIAVKRDARGAADAVKVAGSHRHHHSRHHLRSRRSRRCRCRVADPDASP